MLFKSGLTIAHEKEKSGELSLMSNYLFTGIGAKISKNCWFIVSERFPKLRTVLYDVSLKLKDVGSIVLI